MNENNNIPFTTVYTITYNQCDAVKMLLADLKRQEYPVENYEIIILDDGSEDNTYEELKELTICCPIKIKILHCNHEEDYQSAKRWNQCIEAANPNTEIFIQVDDVRVRSNFIEQHVKWHLGKDEWLVTGAKFEGNILSWDLSKCRRRSIAGQNETASEVLSCKAIWGASLSFTRKAMKKIYCPPYDLPYDERMIGWGYHEVELALRMQKAGVRLSYDPAAGVFHKNHVKNVENSRGLQRSKLVSEGEKRNIKYILTKHKLPELPIW
jgi:glycosyltransferase involved in cell wall biosynthesis